MRSKIFLLIFLLSLSGLNLVRAGDEEKELGIEMKGGSTSTETKQVLKSKAVLRKYNNAKESMGNAFGISSAPPEKIEPAQKAPTKAAEATKDKNIKTVTIHLKNGQTLSDVQISQKASKGVWVEMEGTKLYLSNAEIKDTV